jgi:formiminotetrahydrofolate cyclodeaminase
LRVQRREAIVTVKDGSVNQFIDQLAERRVSPAGGAVAALCAAQAAALVVMVARYSSTPLDTNSIADTSVLRALVAECEILRVRALDLAERDVVAFAAVVAAFSLSQETQEQKVVRLATIEAALVDATDSQAAIAEIGVRLISLSDQLVSCVNPSVIADLFAGLQAARAALSIARYNVESNVSRIVDPDVRTTFSDRLRDVNLAINRAERMSATIRKEER